MAFIDSKSLETQVIDTVVGEDEFIDRILAAVRLKLKGAFTDQQFLDEIAAVHESAHVSVVQRGSREQARLSDGDDRIDLEQGA